MYGGAGLERFRKSQSLEPFSVTSSAYPSVSPAQPRASKQQTQLDKPYNVPQKPVGLEVAAPVASGSVVTQVGGGQSTWQPPDWAVEPRAGAYYLEVLKDKEVIGKFNLDKRRHIFGRLFSMCDFVLDHCSISRQHAAVVTHKNGSIYVIDLGSVHGTFISNERLTKDIPVELKVGQSLRFAASTRTYILRENVKASNEGALNTLLNIYDPKKAEILTTPTKDMKDKINESNDNEQSERASKRIRKARVAFRDETGGELSEVIGVSDGADVETEISPVGVLSLVGKYESLVEITLIPKGKEHTSSAENNSNKNHSGVTDKLQEVLNKVKSTPKNCGIHEQLYGESISVEVGSSWAYASVGSGELHEELTEKHGVRIGDGDGHHDDLFGD